MSNGDPIVALKAAVKSAVALARESRWDDFYTVYQQLFQNPGFVQTSVDAQRQALKLMIHTKGLPPPTAAVAIQAYQAAWYALTRLVGEQHGALDYEMLGIVHLRLGDEPGAKKVFQAGLEVAQAANDGDTCGVFLRHLSTL